MPSTSPDRPGFLSSWWEKAIALVVLVAAVLLVLQWWQGRGPSGPARPGMAPATVVSQHSAGNGETDVTARYRIDGTAHTITGSVGTTAFRQQGRIVWVCYQPGHPTDASLRLPQDDLCGQR